MTENKMMSSQPSRTGEIRCHTLLVCTRKSINWSRLDQVLTVPQDVVDDKSNKLKIPPDRHLVLFVRVLCCLQL